MNIICFGQSNWDWCWTNKQHLMTRLARRGHRVLYIDPDWEISPATSFHENIKRLFPISHLNGLRELDHNLFVYTHQYAHPLRWRPSLWRYPGILKRLSKKLGFDNPVVITMLPMTRNFIHAVEPQCVVYHAIDEMTAFGGRKEHEKKIIRANEEALCKEADLVMGVTPRLHDRLKQLNPRSQLFPNGVDIDHYAPSRLERLDTHPKLKNINHPCIGFFGQIDERMDQDIVTHVARSRPDWQLVFAGRVKKGVDVSRMQAMPNITFTGYLPYDELPSVVKEYDVCVVPYVLNDLSQACSPIKVYEYLASGKPVVATPLDGLFNCREAILTAAAPDEFLTRLEDALFRDTPERKEFRLDMAESHSWESRTDLLENLMRETVRYARAEKNRSFKPYTAGYHHFNHDRERIRYDRSLQAGPKLRLLIAAASLLGWIYYILRIIGRVLTWRRPFLIRRILVVRRSRIGDMVVFLPVLQALRQAFPQARIDLGIDAGKSVLELIEDNLPVDDILNLNFLNEPSTGKRLAKSARLFARGYDAILTGTGFFIVPEAFLSGAPIRKGLYDAHPLQRYVKDLSPLDPTNHEVTNNLRLIDLLTDDLVTTFYPQIKLDEKKIIHQTSELMQKLDLTDDELFILVHAGTQKATRQWPQERLASLSTWFLQEHPDHKILFSGIPSEKELIETIRRDISDDLRTRTINLAGITSMVQLLGLMDRAVFMISHDTGIMHLGRARGCPLIALLGPGNHYRWEPYAQGDAPTIALRSGVPCAPCIRFSCHVHACMKSLAMNDVKQAVSDIQEMIKHNSSTDINRRYHLSSWEQLAQQGWDIPLVTVALTGQHDLRSVANGQTYPHMELIQADISTIDGWKELIRRSKGEFIAVLNEHSRWHSRKISDDVTGLMRSYCQHIAASDPFHDHRPFYTGPASPLDGMMTIRKEWLQQQIDNKTIDELENLLSDEDHILGFQLYVK